MTKMQAAVVERFGAPLVFENGIFRRRAQVKS